VANRFGFPAPDVVARWRAAGATVLRTDQRGAVTLTIAPDGALSLATFDGPILDGGGRPPFGR
jgi:beta-lactamase superfamily II metal-dependent hydrolase